MRLALRGRYTLEHFDEQIEVFLDWLTDNGIDTINGAYLYFNPVRAGRPIVFLSVDDIALTELEVSAQMTIKPRFSSSVRFARNTDQRQYREELAAELARVEADLATKVREEETDASRACREAADKRLYQRSSLHRYSRAKAK